MEELRPGGLALTRRLLEKAASCLPKEKPVRLLDIGCGRGESLRMLADEYGFSCCGIEPDEENLAQARKLCPEMEIVQAQGENLPFAADSFHLALAECTLSLLEPLSEGLAQIRKILKKGGLLLATDVYAKVKEAACPCCGLLRTLYTKETFIEQIQAAGLELLTFEDQGDILKGMLGQLILDYGSEEAYRIIGIDKSCMAGVGYALFVAAAKSHL